MHEPYEYIEEYDYEKGFAAYYREHIVPIAKKYEKSRAHQRKNHYANIFIALIIGLTASYFIGKSDWFIYNITHNHRPHGFGKLLIIPPLFCLTIFVIRPLVHLKSLKEKIFQSILKFYEKKLFYSPYTYIAKNTAEKHTGYFSNLARINCEDLITFNTNTFECTVAEKRYSEKTFLNFKNSIFVYLECQNSINIDAVIIGNSTCKKFIFLAKNLLKKRQLYNSFTPVNALFDEKFNLYTDNSNIKGLLTEEFYSALNQLNALFERGFIFSVKDNSAFIQIPHTEPLPAGAGRFV